MQGTATEPPGSPSVPTLGVWARMLPQHPEGKGEHQLRRWEGKTRFNSIRMCDHT